MSGAELAQVPAAGDALEAAVGRALEEMVDSAGLCALCHVPDDGSPDWQTFDIGAGPGPRINGYSHGYTITPGVRFCPGCMSKPALIGLKIAVSTAYARQAPDPEQCVVLCAHPHHVPKKLRARRGLPRPIRHVRCPGCVRRTAGLWPFGDAITLPWRSRLADRIGRRI